MNFDHPAAVRFFWICRLSSIALGESPSSFAFKRNASSPPRWSTVLKACADTRSRTERPSASEINVTLRRLGRNRRLVLRLEWLTLCPTCAPLPVRSHRRDMANPQAQMAVLHWSMAVGIATRLETADV